MLDVTTEPQVFEYKGSPKKASETEYYGFSCADCKKSASVVVSRGYSYILIASAFVSHFGV